MPIDLESLTLVTGRVPFLDPFEPLFRSRRKEARKHLGCLSDGHCFLDIWEIYPSSDNPIEPKLICSVRKTAELAHALENITKAQPGTIRVYIDEMYSDDMFNSHIGQCYGVQAHRPSSAGFQALAAQCKGNSTETWTQLCGYGFLPNGTTMKGAEDDPRLPSSENNIPQTATDKVLPTWLSSMDRWVETERRIHLGETADGDKFGM